MRYGMIFLLGVILLPFPAEAVIPQLFGPFQALLAVMPQILLFVIAGMAAIFRFHTWKQLAKRLGAHIRRRPYLTALGGALLVGSLAALLLWPRPAPTLAPGVSVSDRDWPMFRGNLGRTGHLDDRPGPQNGARRLWTFDSGSPVANFSSSPAVAGDRIYIGAGEASIFSSHGTLYCLDVNTGQEIWHYDTPRPIFSSPAVVGGRVYVGEGLHTDTDSHLYCLSAMDGSLLWRFPTTSHVESSPCVVEGTVYFGAGDDGVYALDAETGEVRWHYPGVHVDASPGVWQGHVYVGTGYGDPAVYCLDAQTGQLRWRTPVPYSAWGSPAIAEGAVYLGLGNGNYMRPASEPAGKVICLDAETGKIRWSQDTSATVLTSVAVREGIVYAATRDGKVVFLRAQNGDLLYTHDFATPIFAAPAVDATTCYITLASGLVQALDRRTGKILWQFELGGERLLSSPTLARGYFYIGLDRGSVVALGNSQAPLDTSAQAE